MTPFQSATEVLARQIHTDPLIVAKCAGLLSGYDARWSDVKFEVDAVETVVTSDLWNPATDARSRSFTLAGKLDVRGIYEGDGRRVIIDHKTCSEDISDPSSAYWRQLIVENQPRHYELLEWLNGRRADYALWDVVRKPQISPKKLTAADARAAVTTREYYRYHLDDDDVMSVNADGRETLTMYSARLAHDCTVERPQWYFQRRPIPLLEQDLIDHAEDVWAHSQDMLIARRTNRWLKNPGACMMYGSPCKFLGICSGFDDAESQNWKRRRWPHPELPVLDNGDGRQWLTNSRIKSFLTCRRKHYYEYEIGLERVEAEDREALVFGQLWHECLEAWWGAQMIEGEQHGNATGYPAIAVGTAINETSVTF